MRRKHVLLTDRLKLGASLKISPICIGTVASPKLVSAAFEAGINFFFCSADLHWPAYEKLRRGITDLLARSKRIRDEIVVGAVSYVTQPVFCHAPFQELRAAIPRLAHLDVTIAGGCYSTDLLPRLQEYSLHRRSGALFVPNVRATGATFHDRKAALQSVNHRLVDITFTRYNPLHPGAEDDLFPFLVKESPTLLFNFKSLQGVMSSQQWSQLRLAKDYWRPHVSDYYRFALRRAEISGVLTALSSERDIVELEAALQKPALSEREAGVLKDLADVVAGRAELA